MPDCSTGLEMVGAELGCFLNTADSLRAAPAGKASGCCWLLAAAYQSASPLISTADAWADDSLIDG